MIFYAENAKDVSRAFSYAARGDTVRLPPIKLDLGKIPSGINVTGSGRYIAPIVRVGWGKRMWCKIVRLITRKARGNEDQA